MRRKEAIDRRASGCRLRDLGGAVEIRIRDNGIGIPPENKDKLFQPFFRMTAADLVENGDRRRPGTLLSKGTTSLSQTAASGSCRWRPRGDLFCEGSRRSCSMR
jgi:hypothetical protein